MVRKQTGKTSKEQEEVCKLLTKWNRIVDDPKKKKQADKLFEKIWVIKKGNIRPF